MKNLANFKVAVKTREYLIQAIFQMLFSNQEAAEIINQFKNEHQDKKVDFAMFTKSLNCLLYTSPSPRDRQKSRMPSSA